MFALVIVVVAAASACATPSRSVSTPTVVVADRHELPPRVTASAQLATHAPPPPDLFVRCEDRENCPDAVGMLVVMEAGNAEPERCTATLIGSDRVLTASHCLAPLLRHAGASCSATWIAFPETNDAAAEWIACDHVLSGTEAVHDDALHQEHAVLQLTHASERVPLQIEPSAPEPGSIVTVVSVTPHPVYGSTHVLASRLCRAIDATPAEAALGADAANVGWLATCPIARGNSGSPVLDHEGRIRAIVHGGTSLSSAFGVTSSVE